MLFCKEHTVLIVNATAIAKGLIVANAVEEIAATAIAHQTIVHNANR